MADQHDWPLVERALVDHLPTVTNYSWTAPGSHSIGTRVPIGIVEQVGGSTGQEFDLTPDVEVTVVAATRTGCWAMARQVDAAMLRGLNPGGAAGIYIDEVKTAFGWVIDPDRAGDGYVVATATYSLTVRPQATPTEGN